MTAFWIATLLALAALNGCGNVFRTPWGNYVRAVPVITKPSGTITIDRQEFINAWASVVVIYRAIIADQRVRCQAQPAPAAACARVEESASEAKVLYMTVEAKIEHPEAEIDWATVEKLIGLIAKMVL